MRREIKEKNSLNKIYEELYNERYNHQATNFFLFCFVFRYRRFFLMSFAIQMGSTIVYSFFSDKMSETYRHYYTRCLFLFNL